MLKLSVEPKYKVYTADFPKGGFASSDFITFFRAVGRHEKLVCKVVITNPIRIELSAGN